MYIPSFKTKRNHIPILSKQDIETIGEKYLYNFCPDALKTPQAIDVDEFVECYLGATLDYQYLSNDGRYLGMTVFNDTGKVIVFDPGLKQADYIHADAKTIIIDNSLIKNHSIASQRHRYRYTVGHEGGHIVFHSSYYYYDPMQLSLFDDLDENRVPMVQCRASTFSQTYNSGNRKLWTDTDWMEWQANYFSSVLLMPRTTVKMRASLYPKKNDSNDLIVMDIADTFDVSIEAAMYRCQELDLIK